MKKQLAVQSHNDNLFYINKNKRIINVWHNDYYIYSAPADKGWQTKRMSKDEWELAIDTPTFSDDYLKQQALLKENAGKYHGINNFGGI